MTPVPSLIRLVRSPAAAKNISGDAIISQPENDARRTKNRQAQFVDLRDQIEVAAELQHRMLADRMMRSEEGSEFETRHGVFPPD